MESQIQMSPSAFRISRLSVFLICVTRQEQEVLHTSSGKNTLAHANKSRDAEFIQTLFWEVNALFSGKLLPLPMASAIKSFTQVQVQDPCCRLYHRSIVCQ